LTAEQKKLTAEQILVLRGQAAELEASRHQRQREELERREAYVSHVFIWAEAQGEHGRMRHLDDDSSVSYTPQTAWTVITHIRKRWRAARL
jgi:hypothetical protein